MRGSEKGLQWKAPLIVMTRHCPSLVPSMGSGGGLAALPPESPSPLDAHSPWGSGGEKKRGRGRGGGGSRPSAHRLAAAGHALCPPRLLCRVWKRPHPGYTARQHHVPAAALEGLEGSLEDSSKTLQPLPAAAQAPHISGQDWLGEKDVPCPHPSYLPKRPTPSTTSLILLFS